MTKRLEKMFMGMAIEFVKADASYFIGDLYCGDNGVAHFGLLIWSKGDGVLNTEPFFVGIDEDSKFARCWIEFIKKRFVKMIINHKDSIPYFPANSKEEAMYEVYKEVYNN